MANGVTPDGFVTKPLEDIRGEIDAEQRANIDPGLDLDDQSAQGQVNAVFSAAIAELWQLAQSVYSTAYPDSANDASLDNVSSITGTTRSQTTKTIVRDVDVTLNPNAPLPIGSVAHLSSQPNARFVSLAAVPADPIGGVFPVDFEAESAGATTVTAGQLTEIAEPVTGWVAVTNPTDGETGEATETDAQLRIKRLAELEGGGSTNVNSIRANLLRDTTAVDALVLENDTDVTDGNGLTPHSIRAILRGGAAADIAQSIFDTKAAGIATNGAQSLAVLDSQGVSHTMKWDDATGLDYFLVAVVTTNPLTFDSVNGVSNMKTAVGLYINALGIGSDVIEDQVRCALLSVTGVVSVTTLLHDFAAPPSSGGDLSVAFDKFASSDVANLDVSV